jgi:hypothetical protein
MHFPKLTIGKSDDPKGRTFTVHLVASIEAEAISPPSSKGHHRPVLLAYAGASSTVKAFTVNLRAGLTATCDGARYELLRSYGYRYHTLSASPGSALVVAYLPDLFHLHPGVQEQEQVSFVSAPPAWWLDDQETLLRPEFGDLARDHARAMAFVARLDARTPLPIANAPAFHHALYHRALVESWLSTEGDPSVFDTSGLDALGLDGAVLCNVSQTTLAEFLAAATADLLPLHMPARPERRPAPAPRKPVLLHPARGRALTPTLAAIATTSVPSPLDLPVVLAACGPDVPSTDAPLVIPPITTATQLALLFDAVSL